MKHSPDFSSRFRILKGGKISLVVSALLTSVSLLHAAPSGGVVTSGSASIAQSGAVTTINQSSQKASINWQNFSIGATETVNFNQPNVSAITLNRVIGNEKSIIDGALNANGQVWILNSNGVLFNSSAKVNTAGLLATTMNLSDEDFQKGAYSFKGDSSASVINLGEITISDGGYASLLAHSVQNEGTIKAIHGTVTLTGAREATINLNGNSLVSLKVDKGVLDALVENKGAIYADGGNVYLTTNAVNELLKGVVNNTGIIEANSLDDITGEIILFAHGGALHVNGTLEAEGGFIETSGKSLHVEDSTIIKTKKWLLDPDNMTIENTGGASLTGESVSATAIQNALSSADIELQATYDITVNENITWATAKKLTLTAGDEIYVNATIKNTNTTNGGVYFHAANTTDKVIFDTSGLVSIYNVYQLQWLNQALNGKYALGGNIDASATSSWDSGLGFSPIGTLTNQFKGTFDGLGHTITGLFIDRPTTSYVGLFGFTNGATIRNIGIVNANITGKDGTGGLAGLFNYGTITNAYATGSVTGKGNMVGGLVGTISGSTITNSYATVGVIGSGNEVGGLVGGAYSTSSIANSYATGSVQGVASVGGLVGILYQSSPITNSYATGLVTGTTLAGGLVGAFSSGGAVTNSYWDTQTSGKTNSARGVGKTTEEMMNSSTYAGWSILEDTTLAKNYPTLRMASSGNVWVIGTKSTPTPNNQTQTPNVTAIVNGTAITPPVLPNFTPPTQAPQPLNAGGVMLQLASVPSGDVPSQLVGTPEARAMMQGADVGDLRVPLGQNSQIQLVNGGVNLPAGVEQQYFMAQR
ncbi:filamentous hemagglutinin N-terminal domain-containing protein [Sulfurospirillum barnesii]|uniref:Filamentous hemagglutinin family N-terminal domain protein n=1 Tax=Sulfurospirillum barnesii (strain ATCC 700032 / DSM 10660 / SES-3) TaxID=760154 RepID=I3XXT6_SULBS|nr:filamentous hemagglutinin N-terminal domain-containing protein [Sulfurospirillum barnesii]AFL68760.1 filamentous hemagglutinin family N-terminal domain protein [Sulfurospirillum barnesii SES-3]